MDQVIHPRYAIVIDSRILFTSHDDLAFSDTLQLDILQYDRSVTLTQLQGKSRKREVVRARYLIFLCLFRYTSLTLTTIGKIMGGKDHTTVIHGLNTVMDWLETDDELYADYIRDFMRRKEAITPVVRTRFHKRLIKPLL